MLALQTVILAPVGLIAIELGVLAVQQLIQARDVRFVGPTRDQAVHQPAFGAPDRTRFAETCSEFP